VLYIYQTFGDTGQAAHIHLLRLIRLCLKLQEKTDHGEYQASASSHQPTDYNEDSDWFDVGPYREILSVEVG
jgi:hypothetical protein